MLEDSGGFLYQPFDCVGAGQSGDTILRQGMELRSFALVRMVSLWFSPDSLNCFCRWRDDGALKKIFKICVASYEGTELSIDSTAIKASVQAGRGIRNRAGAKHRQDTR